MIDAELEEVAQLSTIMAPFKAEPKDTDFSDPKDQYPSISPKLEDFLRTKKYLKSSGDKIIILSRLREPVNFLRTIKNDVDLTPTDKEFIKFLSTSGNIGATFQLPLEGIMQDYNILNNVKANRNGKLSFFKPAPKNPMKDTMESLLEGVEKDLAAINKEAEHEVLQSKMEKIQALIDKKQSQISRLDEDEDMKDLTDDKKVKEISKDIKALEKAKAKLEKIMSRFKGKKTSPKEVIDEMDNVEQLWLMLTHPMTYIEDAEERLR
jgi:hypothetical protein